VCTTGAFDIVAALGELAAAVFELKDLIVNLNSKVDKLTYDMKAAHLTHSG
jgi:hypothetical protein